MPKVTLNVTLTLQGPILSQSSTPGEYGLDAVMARKPDGTPYLPGTLILGRLRQSWEELNEAAPDEFKIDIAKYLGELSPSGTNNPKRKIIHCSDFVAANSGRSGSTYRIRIDDYRGSVDTGAYLVIDSPFAPGETVEFRGTISFVIPEETNVCELETAIETGLRWITSFGGQRTVGFGRLLDVKVASAHAVTKKTSTIPDDIPTHLRLLIKPHGPFCIAKRRIDENLFESEEIIPGSSIKGALVSTWGMLVSGKNPDAEIDDSFDDRRKELSEAFDKIRFSHAFPRQHTGSRPVRAPLSLVKDQKESSEPIDFVFKEDDELIGDKAPKFAVDWKKSSDVSTRFGWPQLARELRVHTKMDRANRRPDKGKLFAYEMIVPDGHEWEGVVDLSQIVGADTRNKVIMQLIDLLSHGLNSWGKTKTYAEAWVIPHTGFTDVKPHNHEGDDYYIITLQSSALLCDPTGMDETSGREKLFAAYKMIWDGFSDSSLELFRFFATQSLAGGNYLHNRFKPGESYYPWLLTDAGSTFVMKVTNSEIASEKVASWLKNGLPLPDWAVERYKRNIEGKTIPGDHWKCCPYIPENGYGEIAVNIDLNDFPAVTKEGDDE